MHHISILELVYLCWLSLEAIEFKCHFHLLLPPTMVLLTREQQLLTKHDRVAHQLLYCEEEQVKNVAIIRTTLFVILKPRY